MEINQNPFAGTRSGADQGMQRRQPSKPAAALETFADSQGLLSIPSESSVLRPARVVRARALFADEKYPREELLNGIACLLAAHLRSE